MGRPSGKALFEQGVREFAAGNTEHALSLFRLASNKSGRLKEVDKYLGYCCLQLGKYSEAIEFFQEALHYEPRNPLLYSYLAWASCNKGEPDTAIMYLKEGLKVDESEPHLYYVWGEVYSHLGHYGLACSYFEQALELNEKDTPSLMGLSYSLIGAGDYNRAVQLYRQLARSRSNRLLMERAIALINLERLYRQSEQWGPRKKALARLFKIFPDHIMFQPLSKFTC